MEQPVAKDRPAARIGMGLTFEPEIDTKGLKDTVDSAWNAVHQLMHGNILGFVKQTNETFKAMGVDIGGALKTSLFSKLGNMGKGAGEAAKSGASKVGDIAVEAGSSAKEAAAGLSDVGKIAANAEGSVASMGTAMGKMGGQAGKAAGGMGALGSQMSALFSGPQAIIAIAILAMAALVAVTVKVIAIFEEWKKEINKFAPALSENRNLVYDNVMALEALGMQSGFSAEATDKLAAAIAGVDESLLVTNKGFAKTAKILPQLQKFQRMYGLSVEDSANLLGIMVNNLSMSGEEANKFLDTLSTLTVATNLNAKEILGLIEKNKNLVYLFKKSAPELVAQMALIEGAFKSVGESASETFKRFEAGLDMTNAKGVTTVATIARMAGKSFSEITGPLELMEAQLDVIERLTAGANDPRMLATYAGALAAQLGMSNEEFISMATNAGKIRKEIEASQQRLVRLGAESAGVNAQWAESTNELSYLWQNIKTLFGQALKESLADVMKYLSEGAKSLNAWLVTLKSNDEMWRGAVALLKFMIAPVRLLIKLFGFLLTVTAALVKFWDDMTRLVKDLSENPAFAMAMKALGFGAKVMGNVVMGGAPALDEATDKGVLRFGEDAASGLTEQAKDRQSELARINEENARQKADSDKRMREGFAQLTAVTEQGNKDRRRGNYDRRALSDPYLGGA